MLSQALTDSINSQLNHEFYSSNLYLQMSAWAEQQGLTGTAAFLGIHAAEEMMHMRKLFDFVNESDALAIVGAIGAPPTEYDTISELFEQIYSHERDVTVQINAIVHQAFTEQDYSTFNFMQWYVAEQREEEHLIKNILDKIRLIGITGDALFFLDREIGDLAMNKPVMASIANDP